MVEEPRYPTVAEVEQAGAVALQRWVRLLPSPTDEQRDVMDLIVRRYRQLPSGDRIEASKSVGWDRLPSQTPKDIIKP